MATNHYPKGVHAVVDINHMGKPAIRPQVVEMTPEAAKAWEAFWADMRARQLHEVDRKTNLEGCYSRTAEHAAKIALTASWDGVITKDVISWANEVALMSADRMAAMVSQHVADNDSEAELKKVLRIIQQCGPITQNALTRKTQMIPKRRRNEILNDLTESLQIAFYNEGPVTYWTTVQ